eukprot:8101065-Lingulodinium_polyedra.AAC.1
MLAFAKQLGLTLERSCSRLQSLVARFRVAAGSAVLGGVLAGLESARASDDAIGPRTSVGVQMVRWVRPEGIGRGQAARGDIDLDNKLEQI